MVSKDALEFRESSTLKKQGVEAMGGRKSAKKTSEGQLGEMVVHCYEDFFSLDYHFTWLTLRSLFCTFSSPIATTPCFLSVLDSLNSSASFDIIFLFSLF